MAHSSFASTAFLISGTAGATKSSPSPPSATASSPPTSEGMATPTPPPPPPATPDSTWLEILWLSWTPSHPIRSRCSWWPTTRAPSSLGTSACFGPTGNFGYPQIPERTQNTLEKINCGYPQIPEEKKIVAVLKFQNTQIFVGGPDQSDKVFGNNVAGYVCGDMS
ncbi:hypothetical protein ACFX2J_021708 [Malus domestica]